MALTWSSAMCVRAADESSSVQRACRHDITSSMGSSARGKHKNSMLMPVKQLKSAGDYTSERKTRSEKPSALSHNYPPRRRCSRSFTRSCGFWPGTGATLGTWKGPALPSGASSRVPKPVLLSQRASAFRIDAHELR